MLLRLAQGRTRCETDRFRTIQRSIAPSPQRVWLEERASNFQPNPSCAVSYDPLAGHTAVTSRVSSSGDAQCTTATTARYARTVPCHLICPIAIQIVRWNCLDSGHFMIG